MFGEYVYVTEFAVRLAVGSTVSLCAGWLTMVVLRKQSAAARHYTGSLAFFGLALLYVSCALLPGWKLGLIPNGSSPVTQIDATAMRITEGYQTPRDIGIQVSPVEHRVEVPTLIPSEFGDASNKSAVAETLASKTTQSQTWPDVSLVFDLLVWIYFIGIALGLLRIALHHVVARKLVQSSREIGNPEMSLVVRDCLRSCNTSHRVEVLLIKSGGSPDGHWTISSQGVADRKSLAVVARSIAFGTGS